MIFVVTHTHTHTHTYLINSDFYIILNEAKKLLGIDSQSEIIEYKEIGEVLNNNNAKITIPKSEYKVDGEFPIIDQSQKLISGYSNNIDAVPLKFPCVIFGDHTRIVKYYDKPFAQGDSGTKVFISSNKNIITKYIYYCFCNLDIVSRGYNRHWSIVKQMIIPIPPIEIQKDIVKKLDIMDKLINDISEGLPAEIEKRQKQYEYYREKLLTFKKKKLN